MSDIILKVVNISKRYLLETLYGTSLKSEINSGIKGIIKGGRPFRKGHEFWALKNVSFELNRGESLGVIGRNGAGKSTLLKILCEIIEPTSGTVHLNGSVGAVMELATGLLPDLTGRDNIISYCQLLGFSNEKIREIFDDIVGFSELGSFLDTPVKYYSSGMTMRLAFSVMIHLDEDIMLFDEVLAVGDLSFRSKCIERISRLKNRNKTFILVSHSLNEVANYCDKIILLEAGELVAFGRLEDVAIKYYKLSIQQKNFTERRSLTKKRLVGLAAERIYDEASENLVSEISWEDENAPGTDRIRFLKIMIRDSDGQPATELLHTNEVRVEVIYRRIIAGDNNGIALVVSDMMDNGLFMDYPLSLRPDSVAGNTPGAYRLTWTIPPYLLNKGVFKISLLIINERKVNIFKLINAVSFEIIMPEEDPRDFTYYSAIRPDLGFKTERIE
ncbi:MAG: ATP-binding cassette domain-containing protein [Bacteroidetes bacterium]|nr:ATP-binding cassette domain-containing protein [Bacteroidota bacterium]